MTSNEFIRIVRELSQLGQSVHIEVSKEGVRFASEGEAEESRSEKKEKRVKSDDVEMVDRFII